MKISKILATTAVAALLPVMASAATISGQMDISGTVNLGTSNFSAGGNVDLNDPGIVIQATGDFGLFATAFSTLVSLTDISFGTPGDIWSAGGFTFTATAFSNIVDAAAKSFVASGYISGNGYDQTIGSLSFTTQSSGDATVSFSSTTSPVPVPAAGFLLVGGLGAMAALRRRKKA
ncbi:VPLPA-CTERM sorting domain-containing protein [Seohaeicola nanhaiensis]|uniref:VPLPA-CTERM sorting domain-containing protein n=1 Tax=Seohaeicola nanhaiensis TaxID=1387282 RepID=A0ABV9KKS7_9RHOB